MENVERSQQFSLCGTQRVKPLTKLYAAEEYEIFQYIDNSCMDSNIRTSSANPLELRLRALVKVEAAKMSERSERIRDRCRHTHLVSMMRGKSLLSSSGVGAAETEHPARSAAAARTEKNFMLGGIR